MTEKKARQIGSRQALISVGFGLLIAQIIMTYFYSLGENFIDAIFWFTTVKFKLNLLVGIVIMFLSGHLFGQMSGKAILIKKRNFILVGFLCGMTVLLTTAFFFWLDRFFARRN